MPHQAPDLHRAVQAYEYGLAAFQAVVRKADPKDEEEFKSILKLSLENFGMKAGLLAERVDHSKGTISKWINTTAVPSLSTREIVLSWILDQIEKQLQEIYA